MNDEPNRRSLDLRDWLDVCRCLRAVRPVLSYVVLLVAAAAIVLSFCHAKNTNRDLLHALRCGESWQTAADGLRGRAVPAWLWARDLRAEQCSELLREGLSRRSLEALGLAPEVLCELEDAEADLLLAAGSAAVLARLLRRRRSA